MIWPQRDVHIPPCSLLVNNDILQRTENAVNFKTTYFLKRTDTTDASKYCEAEKYANVIARLQEKNKHPK